MRGNSSELTCVKVNQCDKNPKREERKGEPSDAGDSFAVRMQVC